MATNEFMVGGKRMKDDRIVILIDEYEELKKKAELYDEYNKQMRYYEKNKKEDDEIDKKYQDAKKAFEEYAKLLNFHLALHHFDKELIDDRYSADPLAMSIDEAIDVLNHLYVKLKFSRHTTWTDYELAAIYISKNALKTIKEQQK